jgi:Holliday junction resolvasome RuvABC endonuclease subunit
VSVIVGIDPGGGSSSPTGLVKFDSNTLEIKLCEKIVKHTLHAFTNEVACCMAATDMVFIESFFINGRGNNRLQQVIGALKAGVPDKIDVLEDVPNTTMKKVVGGHGRAEKDVVAAGLLGYFATNRESCALIQEWIDNKEWDLTDALAIGVAGWHLKKMAEQEAQNGKAKKAAKAGNAKPKARRRKTAKKANAAR